MDVRSLVTARRAAVLAGMLVLWRVAPVLRSPRDEDPLTVKAQRAPLLITVTEEGTLRPAEALTYRSRVAGREVEIVWLAPEGGQVSPGDQLIRLDTTELEGDLERATQAMRQAQLDVQVADAEAQAARSTLESLSNGKGALDGDEARFNLKIAELKAEQSKKDYESLAPLLDKGYVTREELERAAVELEQAEGAVEIARRRVAVVTEQTVPQERQRATLDVAHRANQREVADQRLAEASSRVRQLREMIDGCTIRAGHAGIVVYEDNMSSNPRRKVRVGDRVTPSQGLVTIPEVTRMLVDTSLREADLHRVKAGQPAFVTLEAYPGVRLSGHVATVGSVARVAPDRPFEGKRFDVVVDIEPSQVELRPEMTARVEVRVAEIADALLVPVNSVFDRSGQRAVQVVSATGLETRPVTLGQSNELYVEVLDGLHDGERVRLLDGTGERQKTGAGWGGGTNPLLRSAAGAP